jgi:hypothetical protein
VQRRPGRGQDVLVQLRQTFKLCEYLSIRQIFEILGKCIPKLRHHVEHYAVTVIGHVATLRRADRCVLQSIRVKDMHYHS